MVTWSFFPFPRVLDATFIVFVCLCAFMENLIYFDKLLIKIQRWIGVVAWYRKFFDAHFNELHTAKYFKFDN